MTVGLPATKSPSLSVLSIVNTFTSGKLPLPTTVKLSAEMLTVPLVFPNSSIVTTSEVMDTGLVKTVAVVKLEPVRLIERTPVAVGSFFTF